MSLRLISGLRFGILNFCIYKKVYVLVNGYILSPTFRSVIFLTLSKFEIITISDEKLLLPFNFKKKIGH